MNTSVLTRKRQRIQALVENKVSFAAEQAELSIYDTYQSAQQVALHSSELLFCGMISGKKIMHVADSQYHSAFLPEQSFVLAPGQQVLIDFPDASFHQPTACLAIEISRDKIVRWRTRSTCSSRSAKMIFFSMCRGSCTASIWANPAVTAQDDRPVQRK